MTFVTILTLKGCWGTCHAYLHYSFTIWQYCESTTSSFHEESDWESGKQYWISKLLPQVCCVVCWCTVSFSNTMDQPMHDVLEKNWSWLQVTWELSCWKQNIIQFLDWATCLSDRHVQFNCKVDVFRLQTGSSRWSRKSRILGTRLLFPFALTWR